MTYELSLLSGLGTKLKGNSALYVNSALTVVRLVSSSSACFYASKAAWAIDIGISSFVG